MVSWVGDGLLVGYDPITKRLTPGLYHFATPGSVDVGAVTRINYPMGSGLSAATYPNSLRATASFNFVAGDFAVNPGKKLSAAMFLCDAANFPAGVTPTPSQILALGDAKVSVYRADLYANSPTTLNVTFAGWTSGLLWNTKYWVLIAPTALVDPASAWSVTNDQPINASSDVNTLGRAMSVWANRTPAKPIISSPVSGSIVLPGATFTLKINPADPDEVTPEDAQKFNDDVNGVQFQYASVPTIDNPDPVWTDLPYDLDIPGFGPYRGSAWHIRGSRYVNGLEGLPELEALVASLGMSVVAGAGDHPDDYQPGKGALPTGEWQIRARTFDYGHPYPNLGTSTTEPGPLGINPATTQLTEPAKDSYPANNTSPWSDPSRVSIPAQVPPPLLVSPVDDVAVPEDSTVRLTWKYRNTHQPPRAQYRRAVQIREVGDPEWATIFDGYSALNYVDLPPVLTQAPVPPLELLSNGGFENPGVDGWLDNGSAVLTNVNDAPNAHSGTHYLQAVLPGVEAVLTRNVVPPVQYERCSFDIWFFVDLAVAPSGFIIMQWLDADGDVVPPGTSIFDPPGPFIKVAGFTPAIAGWNHLVMDETTVGDIHRPPDGVTLQIMLIIDGTAGAPPYTFRFDDASIMAYGPDTDDFSISATNEYEWRVQTTDTDLEVSNYSTPGRFWVVPINGSGGVRPVPTETIDGATLGCGTHRVEIFRRGGSQRVGELKNINHVDWGRVRDDISTAQIIVSGWDLDCGNLLASLQTWAYEVLIWRNNGYSEDRVWEGPITLLTYETDKVTIEAKDVMGYAYRRIIKQKMTDFGNSETAGTTVVDRARRVLQNTFAPDDPNVLAYLQVLARDDDAKQYRSTPAYSRTAFEEVDDMAANAGLDYTVVGRSILLWGTKHRIGTLPEFKDKDLGSPPIVSEYGMSMANLYSVSNGDGVHGEANRLVDGADPIYGLVEMLSSTWATDSEAESGTYTQAGLATIIKSFEDFAERSISDRYPPPVVVRVPDNTTLNPSAVISIQHLVPGVVIPLRSTGTLREVVASQKLDSIKVVEEAGKETVSITLSPFSRDDAGSTDGEAEE